MWMCQYIGLCHIGHQEQGLDVTVKAFVVVGVLKQDYSVSLYISLICFSLQHVLNL